MIIKPKTPEQVAKLAEQKIIEELNDVQKGLYCRFKGLNITNSKYFRFSRVNLFAGLSGHFKSTMLYILENDFLNKELNNVPFPIIIFSFNLEMEAEDALLKNIGQDLNLTYSDLLSSTYNRETDGYNKLSNENYFKVKKMIEDFKSKLILFFDVPSSLADIDETVTYYHNLYYQKYPNFKLIIDIDHTLLIERKKEKNELELMKGIGILAIKFKKKFGAMVNLIGQLNNNIESTERILKPELHYPKKSDIYAQAQVFNACDNVYVFNRPEMLGIKKYGLNKYDTTNLLHGICLKNRFLKVLSLWFEINRGNLIEKIL